MPEYEKESLNLAKIYYKANWNEFECRMCIAKLIEILTNLNTLPFKTEWHLTNMNVLEFKIEPWEYQVYKNHSNLNDI